MSVRWRLAITVALAALIVLAAAAGAGTWLVRQRMYEAVRREAVRAVESTRFDTGTGRQPEAPVGGPTVLVRETGTSDEVGGVQRWTAEMERLVERLVADAQPGVVSVELVESDGIPAYAAVLITQSDDGSTLVRTALASLRETERTTDGLQRVLFVGVPIVAVLLGWLAAAVAGRALRPVAVMREHADLISHGTLHRRLTPATKTPELRALASTMNSMLDRLERSASGQRRFVSDVSHELRSPLATVRGSLELAVARPDSITDTGPIALSEIDRLDTLVADLLALSRLDEGNLSCTEEVDVDELVTTHVSALRASGVRVDTSGVRAARASGDRRALDQMVRNLLDNAGRHADSTVGVALCQGADRIELVVDDDGPGIPVEAREQVFERFARLDEARTRGDGGSGLGLAIAAAAAWAHGGSIVIGEAPLGGARFAVTLQPTVPAEYI